MMANNRKVRRGQAATKPKIREKVVYTSRAQAHSFLDFIRERGVMSLAVGVILGSVVTALVRSFVDDIINPLVGLILAEDDLSASVLKIGEARLAWGNFISTALDFLVIALVVFLIFKALGLEKLDKKKSD